MAFPTPAALDGDLRMLGRGELVRMIHGGIEYGIMAVYKENG